MARKGHGDIVNDNEATTVGREQAEQRGERGPELHRRVEWRDEMGWESAV